MPNAPSISGYPGSSHLTPTVTGNDPSLQTQESIQSDDTAAHDNASVRIPLTRQSVESSSGTIIYPDDLFEQFEPFKLDLTQSSEETERLISKALQLGQTLNYYMTHKDKFAPYESFHNKNAIVYHMEDIKSKVSTEDYETILKRLLTLGAITRTEWDDWNKN